MNMTTVKEFLNAHFGKSANNIVGIDHPMIGGGTAGNPQFMCWDDGRLQTTCGGDVILGFTPDDRSRTRIYLVRDDDAKQAWLAQRRQGKEIHELGGPCPHAVLRLVASA